MRKSNKILRAMGYMAPVALPLALAAPIAMGYESTTSCKTLWAAKGEKPVWETRYGELWMNGYPPVSSIDLSSCPPKITVRPNFEYDKYSIGDIVNKEELGKIDQYVDRLKSTPEKEIITIVGHTDARGSEDYNLKLGLLRAEVVRDYIKTLGYPENMLRAESRGKEQLLPGFAPDSVAQRRVTLTETRF